MKSDFGDKNNIHKMLRYAAAALSAVSFFTTLNGIKGIITNNIWLAGLISFGIQAIILVMGLWSIPALKAIPELINRKFLSRMLIAAMVGLYVFALYFSSFFSYVYMSTAAYHNVQLEDYNMEVELFLTDKTRTLKNRNNSIHDVLLEKIRKTAPEFRTLQQDYQQKSSAKVANITNEITKYEVASIPDSMKFTVDGATRAHDSVNDTPADSKQTTDFQRLEQDINMFITYYNANYYPSYVKCYEGLKNQTDASQVKAQKRELQILITTMENQKTNLSKFGYTLGSVRGYVESKCNGIISQYDLLIAELRKLESAYQSIEENPEVTQGEGLELQAFYEALYSDKISTKTDLEKVEENLNAIVTAYIRESDEIDEKLLSDLVECIDLVGKLHQCVSLSEEIEKFQENNLQKAYSFTSINSRMQDTSSSPDPAAVENQRAEEEKQWKTARNQDIDKLISFIKALPDGDQILKQDDKKENSAVDAPCKMETSNYVSNTLLEAYKVKRSKLDNISDLETAWNYLSSKNHFLAIWSFLIAIFLDITSLLIGFYMYTFQSTKR